MAYADFEYYKNQYSGNAIPASDFPRLVNRASIYLDDKTMGRISSDSVPDKVKLATCAIADLYHKDEKGGDLASETVGSYSRSFNKAKLKSLEVQLWTETVMYLGNTGLLYRGIAHV